MHVARQYIRTTIRTTIRTNLRHLAAASALALAACGSDETTAPDAARQMELARFPALEAARAHVAAEGQTQRAVVTTAAGWEAFWRGLVPDPNAGGPPPAVDFSREMVIAYVMPVRPSAGYDVEFERVTERADHIEAAVVVRSPGTECFSATVVTRPFDVVRVPRRDKPVRFAERAVTTSCQTPANAPTAPAASDTVRAPLGRAADAGDGTRVTLLRVVDDSRCPINALCIWEGSAAVTLRFERAGASADTTLHTNERAGPATFAFGGAQFRLFGLTPAPVAGQDPPKPEAYTALLAVRRN